MHKRTLTTVMMTTVLIVLSLTLSGCGLFGGRNESAVAPSPTRTPIPLPTQAPPPPPAAQPAQPPASQSAPAAKAPQVSNFTAQFTGRAIEGTFDVASDRVNYTLRFKRVEAVDGALRITGDLDYTIARGGGGRIPNVMARVTTEGEGCEQVTLETQAISAPDFGATLPAQRRTVNLNDTPGANDNRQALTLFCQVARMAQSNPNNPLVRLLLDQVNRQLE